jgi:uncharacterized protein
MATLKKIKKGSDQSDLATMDSELLAEKLITYFKNYQGAIIAYSGGVDSSLLSFIAHLSLGKKMLAVLGDSPSLSRREYLHAVAYAKEHGFPLKIVKTKEMADPLYVANKGDRCYYCKKSLFEKVNELLRNSEAFSEYSWPLFYGANLDDLCDHRPGMLAAKEASVKAPYIELGMDKKSIRALCTRFSLKIAVKPAMPCLSSRISYREEVTLEKLDQVEKAEDFLFNMGIKELRVRHHGDIARIEVLPSNFSSVIKKRKEITSKFKELGFKFISIDLEGFRSGSLNTLL